MLKILFNLINKKHTVIVQNATRDFSSLTLAQLYYAVRKLEDPIINNRSIADQILLMTKLRENKTYMKLKNEIEFRRIISLARRVDGEDARAC